MVISLAGTTGWSITPNAIVADCALELRINEGIANFLVNRRMNKSQQMRWSRRGADLPLQARCAVYNGTFGSAYGQKFHPANDSSPAMAITV
jgi:hypothetical protein